jgi:hypothetical protein
LKNDWIILMNIHSSRKSSWLRAFFSAWLIRHRWEAVHRNSTLLERTKTMMNKMMMTAVAAFALATGAKAQYYNYDVTIHEAPQPPSLSELMATSQMINEQNIVQFRNAWIYQWDNVRRTFWVTAVPGLGAAIAHGDWSAAWSFFCQWTDAEMAYEKRYHRYSPAYVAANNSTFIRTHTRNHK